MPLIVHSTCRAPASMAASAVGHREAQVVVAVDADHRPPDVGHLFLQAGDEPDVLRRRRVADRVGDVDGRRAGVDDRFDHLGQVGRVRAGGIFGAELHVGAQRAGVLHAGDRHGQRVLAGHAELVLQVDVGRGQERVDARVPGALERFPGAIDVAGQRAAQARHDRVAERLGHGFHRLEVAIRRDRESGFDNVDAQLLELLGEPQLLFQVHRAPGRLLTVTQRGIAREVDDTLARPHR